MAISCTSPPADVLTTRPRAANQTIEQLKSEAPERSNLTIDRFRKIQGAPLGNLRCGGTQKEFECGWPSPPTPLNTQIAETTPMTPRHLIEENHGARERKTRRIDDFESSGINGLLTTSDADAPDNIGRFLAVAAYYKTLSPAEDLLAFSVDYKHSYKQVEISLGQGEFAPIRIDPPE